MRDMVERVSNAVLERIDGVEMARNDSQSVKQSVLCHQSVSYVVIITHYCSTQLTLLTHHYRKYLYSDTAQHSLQSTKSYNPFPQTNTLLQTARQTYQSISNLVFNFREYQLVFVVITEFLVSKFIKTT